MISKFEPSVMRPEPNIPWVSCNDWTVSTCNDTFIDMTSGIFTSNFGHCNHHVKAEVVRYLNSDRPLSCFTWPNQARRDFIDKLISIIPKEYGFDCCLLYDSGSLANEHAIQVAQSYLGKSSVYSLVNGYHGNTRLLRNNINSIDGGIVIFESVRGWDCRMLTEGQLNSLKQKQEDGGLLICDEIQMGFGRTGRLFGFENYSGFIPDIVTVGKGMSSGFPLSGVLFNHRLLENWDSDVFLCNTHSGNCVSCVAGCATLDEYKRFNLDKIRKFGRNVLEELNNISASRPDVVSEVNGCGYTDA
jgi:4-aminobutyrate aminotransferase-like enzyme